MSIKKERPLEYQNLFKAIFEQSAFPMQIFGIQGDLLESNRAWEIMFHASREEARGYNVFQDPQIINSPVLQGLKKALKGETVELEAFYYDPKQSGNIGRTRWFETCIYPVFNNKGDVEELAVIHKDVTEKMETQVALVKSATERMATEEKLRLITERLSLAVKAGKIGIWEWVPGTEDIQWDETAENIYGAIPGLLPKTVTSFNELVHPDDRDLVYLTITGALRDRKSYRVDHRLVRPDGAIRWVQMTGVSVYNENNSPTLMMGTVMDITDRIEAIKTRDEFVSIASHELKTPLQTLILQNQLRKRSMMKTASDDLCAKKIEQMIETDLRHLSRINRLIDDMLDISKFRSGKLNFIKEKVEFTTFLKDVLDRFKPQVESVGSYLRYQLCEPVKVEIDTYRMEQVIVNLLTNALKYGAGKPINIEVVKSETEIKVLVHDQGPGVKEEDRERIFERFERAVSPEQVSGLGLGLYIAKQIVEQNNGHIYVDSRAGGGSTFILDLPY
jgi:PAS domain S-box-containing protein